MEVVEVVNTPEPLVQVVQSLINLLAWAIPFIFAAFIPRAVVWVKEEWERVIREQPEWVQSLIEQAALFGATFAEKVDLAGMLEEYGRDKKTIALEAARKWLLEQGYEVDLSVLDAAIENILFHNPEVFKSKPKG